MKAPDKIYVPESKECSGCVDMRVFAEYELKRGIEYIRKETLLEWLKKEIAFYPDEIYSNDHYEDGAKETLQGVINKLDEM